MLEPPFDRDREESFTHPAQAPDDAHVVLLAHARLDDRRGGEDATTGLAEDLDERAVVELPDDAGPDPLLLEPLLEPPPQGAGLARQQERCAVHRPGKSPPVLES